MNALRNANEFLAGPLVIRTLDTADYKYRPDYNNDDQSNDPNISKGANYHGLTLGEFSWIWEVPNINL